MNSNRVGATATLLNSGAVLVMGGYWEGLLNQPLSSAELYPPSSLVPASLVSISVNPLNPTLPAGTAQSLIAVGTFSDNSTQDIVSATWGSSDTTIAAVTNDSSNRGSVFGVSPGLTTVNACTGTVCGSTTITVGPSGINPPPTILSASAIGSLLTISGNGFGTSSSAGIVTINGTVAIPNSYSNTQIVVPIPVQMTTGAVMVTVAGIPSNVAFFNVLPGSTTSSPIIASLSPVSGAIGTSVTITGTNLGSAEVSAVMFNGAGAVPSSWSETKIVVIVPNAATTGNVVVTVGGTPSAGVNFTVLQPTSMNITPANPTGNEGGSVQFHATAVYASGSMQDVTSAVSWSSSQTGVATIAGNGLAALLGVGQANIQAIFGNLSATANLTVNWSGSSSAPYQVFPSSLKMITGDTRTLSVADGSGNPVTGLRWSSTNSDVVKLSTANPPLITGVAPGSATVYAGIVPVPVTVYSAGTVLPPGTPIWSLPLPGGSSGGTVSIIPAIPYSSSTDPTNDPAKEASRIRIANDDTSAISSTQSLIADIYVLNGSTLQAITSDKNVAWTVFGLPDGTTVTAGFLGDALLLEPLNSDGNMRLQRADSGGNLSTVYTSPSTNSISFVPHPSGVIYIQDGNTISVVSASTQSLIASVTLFQDGVAGSIISSLIVAGDGNAYIEYETFEGTGSWADYYYCPMAGTSGLVNTVGHVFLLEIRPDGTTANIHLEDYTNEWGCKLYAPSGAEWTAIPPFDMPSPDPSKTYAYGAERWDSGTFVANGSIITNADDGVVVSIPRQDVICEDTIEYTAWTATMLIPPPYTYYEWTAQEYGYSNDQCNGRSGVKLTTDMVLVSNGSVVSTTNIDLYGFMPTLQRSDGSYIGTGMDQNFDNTLAAVDFVASTSGQTVTYPVWQQKDVIGTPLYALSDGGVVVTTSANGTLGTLFTLDAAGNIASQMPDAGAVTSWTGSLYVKASTGSVSSIVASPPATAEDSYWAFRGGNPSGNDVALPQCPCLLQSAGSVVSHDEVSAREASLGETSREAFHNEAATQSGGRCQVADGSKSTFLLIIGDPGNGEHNIGNGWNLAARQKENDLVAEGHRVVSCRASSVQDVNQALTQNGLIDGGVIYFGHSGPYIFTDPGTKAEATLSILAVGQGRGLDTNLAYYNVNELCDPAQGCNVNKILGANAAMLINGCRAGVPVGGMRGDASGTSRYPIARLLKSQLQRGVYAYMVGMYLSQLDAAHDPQYGPKQGDKVPNSLPMYMVPLGAPFHKPSPTAF